MVMLHGFPGLWYSWRKQMVVVAEAGFTVVALDKRGFGRSDRPADIASYSSANQVADVMGVLDYFEQDQAVFFGQDFGARLTWNIASRVPQRTRAAVVFGVPYDFNRAGQGDGNQELSGRNDRPPSAHFAEVAKQHFFHMHYFQEVGLAEAELCPRPRDLLLRLYWALSAEGNLLDWRNHPSEDTGYLAVLEQPKHPLPWPWLSEEDLNYMLEEYTCAGEALTFAGGLNAYRVQDINWQIAKDYENVPVLAPVLYIAGEKDPVNEMLPPLAYEHMRRLVPNLTAEHLVPAAGHFVMQEQPGPVNTLILDFLSGLSRRC